MYYNSQWFSFLLWTNLFLVISNAPYPILIHLPSPLPHIYPAYVNFEGQSVLLTSESSFYLTINPDLSYSITSAADSFGDLYKVTEEYRGYTKNVYGTITNYYFTTLNKKMVSKQYISQQYVDKTIDIDKIDPSMPITPNQLILSYYGISFIGSGSDAKKGIVYQYNLFSNFASGYAITSDEIADSGLFDCKTVIYSSTCFCLYSKGGQVIYQIEYDASMEDFYYETSVYTMDASETDIFLGVQFIDDSPYIFAVAYVSSEYLWVFNGDADDMGIYINEMKKTNIKCKDISSFYITKLSSNYHVVSVFDGDKTILAIYTNSLERISIEGKEIGGIGQVRFHFLSGDTKFILVSAEDNSDIIYYTEYEVVTCQNIVLSFSIRVPNTITINDLAGVQVSFLDDNSGMVFTKINDDLGGILQEVNSKDEVIGDIVYDNTEHLVSRFTYEPHSKGSFMLQFRIYYIVTDDFYLPTSQCTITFVNTCYSECKSCTEIGNEENHLCSSCYDGSYYIDGEEGKSCYFSPPPYYYLNSTTCTYRKCLPNCYSCDDEETCNLCSDTFYLLSDYTKNEKDTRCVTFCDLSNSRWHLNEDNEFTCLNEQDYCTPDYAFYNPDTHQCLNKEESEEVEDPELEIPQQVSEEDIKEYLDKNILDYYEKSYILHTNNFSIIVYNSLERNEDLFNNLTTFDLSTCEKKLKERYNLTDKDPIIIAQLEKKVRKDPINATTFNIYSMKGEKLDLSICSNDTFRVNHKISSDQFTLSNELINELHAEGIDVFNSEDDFFSDKCYSYSSNNDSDVAIRDRRNEYYQGIPLCTEQCNYVSMTVGDNYIASCECSYNSAKDNTIEIKNSVIRGFKNAIAESNYAVIKCYKQVFDINLLAKNIGSYLLLLNFISQVVNLIFYILKGNEIFKKFINYNENNTISNSAQLSSDEKNLTIVETPNLVSPFSPFEIKLKQSSTFLNKPKNEKSIKLSNKELDRLDLRNAILHDNRSFSSLILHRIKTFHPIYIAFFSDSNTTVKFIEISNFLFGIATNLTFNALFFSDKYISNNYHSGYNFIYEVPKSIFSSLSGIVISLLCTLIKMDFPHEDFINEKKHKKKEYKRMIIKKMKHRNIIFFIILFAFSILFWYFVTAFCAVYQNSQVSWILGALTSIILSFLIPIGLAFVVVSLRFIAIEYSIQSLFYCARLIETYHNY